MTIFTNAQIELAQSIEAECAARNAESYINSSDMQFVNDHSAHFAGASDEQAVESMVASGMRPIIAKDVVRIKNSQMKMVAQTEAL